MSTFISTSKRLGVQKICAITVCKTCKLGLPSERSAKCHLTEKHSLDYAKARSHAKKASDAAKATISEPHYLREAYLHAPFKPPSSHLDTAHSIPPVLPPLEGLSTTTGYQCQICSCCYTSEKGMRDHFSEKHGNHPAGLEGLWQLTCQQGQILLQTLFGGSRTTYFSVTSGAAVGDVFSVPASSTTNHHETSSPRGARPLQTRVESENFPTPTNGRGMCFTEQDQERLAELEKALRGHASNAKETSNHPVNVYIARTKLDKQLSNYGLSMEQAANVSAHLLDRNPVEKLVVADITSYLLKVPSLIPDISPSVLQDVNLRGYKEFTAVSKRSAESCARNFARIIISANRLQNYDFFPNHIRPKVSPYFAFIGNSSTSQSDRLNALHELLSAIFFEKLDNIDSPRQLFIYQFITFASVIAKFRSTDNHFRFVDAADLSPVLAALLYGITSCALTEIHSPGKQANSLSTESPSIPHHLPSTCDQLNDLLKEILASFKESSNSASTIARELLTTAHTVNKAEDVDFVFDLCQDHTLCGIVKGVHIKMQNLGNTVKTLHREIKSIFSNLLFGANLPDEFTSNFAVFEDSIQDKSPGFSFLVHPNNIDKVRNYAYWLFHQITKVRPSGKAAFSPTASTNISQAVEILRSKVRRDTVQKWLMDANSVMDKLLACLHLSSGSPARSTELETLTLYNTEYYPRNVYISQGRLVFVTRYSKTRWLTGTNKVIPRFPDSETSKLFLTHLALFRPLEAIFTGALFGDDAMTSHMTAVFTERGSPYSSSRIRDVIRSAFHAHSLPILYNDFRQYSAGINSTVAENSPSLVRDELTADIREIAHLQAGHSPETAEANYARKSDDIPSLPTSALSRYRMFSFEWHRHMGLAPKIHNAPNPAPLVPSPNFSSLQSFSESLTHSISEKVSETFKKEFQKFSTVLSYSSSKRSYTDTPASTYPPSKQAFVSRIRSPPEQESLTELNRMLPLLRAFLNDDNALFTSELQLQVTTAVREAKHNIMVLMPTGSGKSITFLLPASMEHSASTVVFVPLAALVHEHVNQCSKLGIQVATWETRHIHAQVYVLSVDHSVHELRTFLRGLREQGKLKRIVIDEVHLLLFWFLFRPSIQRLLHALHVCEHSVQLVLLTATLPPGHREKLLNLLSVPSVLLYAAPTSRPNLRFTVVECTHSGSQSRFMSHRTLMMNTLSSTIREFINQLLEQNGGRILIFTLYRSETERIQRDLQELLSCTFTPEIPVRAYHAAMPSEELKKVYNFWKSPEPSIKIAVATSAFGTGLDVPNVRMVLHFEHAFKLNRNEIKISEQFEVWNFLNSSCYDSVKTIMQ